jgi:CubicO group peptidase (beta-lactamase class C family)
MILLIGCAQQKNSIPSEITADGIGTEMDTFLTRLNAFGYHGSALVAQGENILLHKAYGEAQVAEGIRNYTSTVFSTGSVTKQFTAAAILKLEMDGRLKTSDSISRFFDDVPDDKAGITIHHLLTHSSGLAGDFGPDDENVDRETYLERIFSVPLDFPIGGRYEYSNAGYSLLAAIIETVSGMEYEAFVQKNLFMPSGMHHTGLKNLAIPDSLVSHSHNKDLSYPSPLDRPSEYYNLKGNGGIVSTPADMYRWHLTLKNREVLSEEACRKLFVPYKKEYDDGDSYYGYGWVVQEYGDGDTLIWHNGGAMPHGWSCAVYHFVSDDLICIVFSNATIDGSLPVDHIVDNLSRIAMGEAYVLPPEVGSVPVEKIKDLSGEYSFDEGGLYIRTANGRLVIEPEGQAAVNILFPTPYAPMLDKYNGKTEELVNLIAAGDYKSASDYFRPSPGGNIWKSMAREWWQSFDSLGSFVSVDIQGTAMAGGAHTHYLLNFEQGQVKCRFFWMGGKCGGMATSENRLGKELLPESATRFAGYNLRDATAISAEIMVDNSVAIAIGDRQFTARAVGD